MLIVKVEVVNVKALEEVEDGEELDDEHRKQQGGCRSFMFVLKIRRFNNTVIFDVVVFRKALHYPQSKLYQSVPVLPCQHIPRIVVKA